MAYERAKSIFASSIETVKQSCTFSSKTDEDRFQTFDEFYTFYLST